jgi:hypothetical protein
MIMANWSLITEHRSTGKGLLQSTWPILTLGGMLLGFGIMMLFVPTKPGQETGTRIAGVVCILGSLALIGVAPWRWMRSASVVRIYQEGLQWQRGGMEHRRSWEDVREVYRKELYVLQNNAKPSDWNRRSDLRLIFTDGEEMHFNHILSEYSTLANYVQQATAERILPVVRSAVDNAGVAFGPLRLEREGLTMGREVFPFASLSKLWVGNGFLGWYDSRGNKREIALKNIPNYPVLLRLLNERMQPLNKS